MKTQAERILERLSQGWTCSRELHAIAWRFSARIHDLRNKGHEIESLPCTCNGVDKSFKHWRIVPK